ncbi:MAG: hypothetical protein EXR93_02670 [Gemmatimonadetes bacterium]|nr:hypothetical protein [Gemmatimonadota bacterium]
MQLIKGLSVPAAATLLAAIAASPLTAQTVRGSVSDSRTGQPLASVSVELVVADTQVAVRALTDSAGKFLLTTPGPGTYVLRAQRLGYRSFESPMVLNFRGEMNLPIALAAVGLAPVAVTATTPDPYLKGHGFYDRMADGGGRFLDPAAVQRLAPRSRLVVDLLAHVPGVQSAVTEESGGVPFPLLRSCARGRSGTQAQRSQLPRIYVDGVPVGQDALVSLLPTDVLAAEVFIGPARVPLEYGGMETPCGVIVIWTKH